MGNYRNAEYVCENCGSDIYDTDHLEWTHLVLCPTCYDKHVYDNTIDTDDE